MSSIRKARQEDLGRIAEIEIFNYRLYFYPIFKNDSFYFSDLQVTEKIREYAPCLQQFWVYDDGAVKGFVQAQGEEIRKLFVEPVLHSRGIGSALLKHVLRETQVCSLWALEKNHRAIAFYQRHGFLPSGERKPEEGTEEYLLLLKKK